MNTYNNIKLPVGLASEVLNSKTSRKSLETYYMLKSIAPNGWVKNTVKDLTALEKSLKICYKTIKTRLKHLSKIGLVKINQTNIVIASTKKINALYSTGSNGHYTIKGELLNKIKLEDYFIALAIKEKKEECSKAFYAKQKRLALDKEIIKGVFYGEKPKGSYKEAVTEAHLNDYVQNANTSSYSYAFDFARADVEIGYKKLSNMLGYKGKGSLAYTKRKLQKAGVITIQKRKVEISTKTHSTKQKRKTSLGTINYDSRKKCLVLQMPDKLTINNQKQIINHEIR